MDMKIGVLGFGGMGHWHAENARLPGVQFIAACDIDPVQVADAGELGLKVYLNDEDGFFHDPEINTILLTVPNHLHKQYAIKAAQAGKNIICEKPAALSIEDFDEMVQTAKECGVLFEVHQNRRWDKDFNIVKKVYDENMIGNIFNIESTLHSPNGRMHNWHTFKKYGGGMVYDWGVHLIDQALQLVDDKIDCVFADLKGVFHEEVEDYYKIIIKFRQGQTVTLSHSTYTLKKSPRWLVAGDKGTAIVQSFACDGNIYTTSELLTKLPPKIVPNVAGPTRSFIPLPPGKLLVNDLPEVHTDWLDFYRNYLDVMNGEAEFAIKNEQVRRVLAVIDAVFLSSETRSSIRFTYDDEHEIVH